MISILIKLYLKKLYEKEIQLRNHKELHLYTSPLNIMIKIIILSKKINYLIFNNNHY